MGIDHIIWYRNLVYIGFYLCPRMLICCSIHLGYYNRFNAMKMFCKLVECWFQGLAMATPRSINLILWQQLLNTQPNKLHTRKYDLKLVSENYTSSRTSFDSSKTISSKLLPTTIFTSPSFCHWVRKWVRDEKDGKQDIHQK